MFLERERPKDIPNPDIEIVGSRTIGEKARQLAEKTPTLYRLGFYTPRRTMLAEGFFDGFFQRNNLGANLRDVEITLDIEERVRRGSFPVGDFQTIRQIERSFEDPYLMIRSSAEGDARGTGIYESFRVNYDWDMTFGQERTGYVRKSIQKSLASYFSRSAIEFRRDANLDEGFGVIIEPALGGNRGPILSGYGYTSRSGRDGYVNLVNGFGLGGNRKGEVVNAKELETVNGNLIKLLEDRHDISEDIPWSMRWKNAHNISDAIRYLRSDDWQQDLYDIEVGKAQLAPPLNLFKLFEMMRQMEDIFGKPQYFEWALTRDKTGSPAYSILQIADIDERKDHVEFANHGRLLVEGCEVVGSGVAKCKKIVICLSLWEMDRIGEFNRSNADYVLIFSDNLITNASWGEGLKYEDISNASVLIEFGSNHTMHPLSHFEGQLDMTGKLFGVLKGRDPMRVMKELMSPTSEEDGLTVYDGEVEVVASEREDKLVVYLPEEH